LFKIFETNQFLKDLKKLDKPDQRKIYSKILDTVYSQIKNNLYFGKDIKKLQTYKPETWRYRIGSFRLFYEIDGKEKVISIITIEIRSKSY